MKTIAGLMLFFAVVGYGGYAVFMVAKSYFQISDLLDEVVPRELPKLGERDRWRPGDRAAKLRESIVESAAKSGITLDPGTITVTEDGSEISVTVNYSYPVVKLGGRAIKVPISPSRSFRAPTS